MSNPTDFADFQSIRAALSKAEEALRAIREDFLDKRTITGRSQRIAEDAIAKFQHSTFAINRLDPTPLGGGSTYITEVTLGQPTPPNKGSGGQKK